MIKNILKTIEDIENNEVTEQLTAERIEKLDEEDLKTLDDLVWNISRAYDMEHDIDYDDLDENDDDYEDEIMERLSSASLNYIEEQEVQIVELFEKYGIEIEYV